MNFFKRNQSSTGLACKTYPTLQNLPRLSPGCGIFLSKTTLALKLLVLKRRERPMLWKIAAVLFILWLLGFALHVAGALIHLVLVIAIVMFVIHLFTGRRGVA